MTFDKYGVYRGRAVVFAGPRKAEIWQDIAFPSMDDDGVVLKTGYSTISRGTELDLYTGQMHGEGRYAQTYPMLPGYMPVGEVVEVGRNITHLKTGDYAFGSNLGGGYPDNLCCAWGGHTEYWVVTQSSFSGVAGRRAVKIPNDIPLECAGTAVLGGVANRGVKKVGVRAGETVLVIGQGVLGIYAALLSKIRGGRVVVSDLCVNRLETASMLGIRETINASEENTASRIRELTDGQGPDVIIEVTGEPNLLIEAFDMIRVGGRIHAQGAYLTPFSLRMQSVFAKEFTLSTTCAQQPEDTSEALSLLARQNINISKLVSDTVPVEKAAEAYELIHNHPEKAMTVTLKW